jgi:hypothetical protein
MKTNQHILLGLLLLLGVSSCTKNFEKYNTDNTGLSHDQLIPDRNYLGLLFPQIQSSVYFNYNNTDWEFQLQQNLNADVFSGYMMSANPFAGGLNNLNYFMMEGWNSFSFTLAYNNVMAPVYEIRRQGAPKDAPDFWALALILKVASMHRVTDVYGPIPYTQYGSGGTSAVYDSQKDVYYAFFKDLDTAVTNLKAYLSQNAGKKPFAKFDMIYAGDYSRWLKFANSLRLRLAMHIVKADPAKAKAEGEKALDPANGGVITLNSENVLVSGYGLKHPLRTMTDNWSDMSMGASMECYLAGYKDPRLSKYFDKATDAAVAGKYKGIRIGSVVSKSDYGGYSTINFKDNETIKPSTPIQLMTAAELYFLRAEAALRGWSHAGGSVKELYEKGVNTSLDQWGEGAQAAAYLEDAANKPIDYADPKNRANNALAPSTITIRWDEGAATDVKMERIITQKWIAMFPEGQEAWTEYRRTGYPKLLPVVNNNSGGKIDTKIQIRRLPFPQTEYVANKPEVEKAIQLLGGPDNGGTRLWWDKP